MSKPTKITPVKSLNEKSKTKPRELSKERSLINKTQVSGSNVTKTDAPKSKVTSIAKIKDSSRSVGTKESPKSVLAKQISKSVTLKQSAIKESKNGVLKTDATKDSKKDVSKIKSVVKESPRNVAAAKKTVKSDQTKASKSKRSILSDTQTSSRVTRTQYFPSKNLYSNAVREHLKSTANSKESVISSIKPKPSVSSDQKNTRPKLKKVDETGDQERPRTATLRKGSIVNSNIAGPDIPKSETASLSSADVSLEAQLEPSEDNYEDDFDSYESDFEEYHSSSEALSTSSSTSSSLPEEEKHRLLKDEATSSDDASLAADDIPKRNTSGGTTDEERMLDSGNFDMPESKHKQLLDNIKESNEKELFIEGNRSNMASLSDEGFEDGKLVVQAGSGKHQQKQLEKYQKEQNQQEERPKQQQTQQFINFADAQKKRKHSKVQQKRKKRGEEILSMIRLDSCNFTLFDIPPIPYDDFIKSYGRSNTIQVSIQTGDDNISEETQTDKIEIFNKWTQFPTVSSKIDVTKQNYLEMYKRENIGVGGDDDDNTKSSLLSEPVICNTDRLDKFLARASDTILTLLQESSKEIDKTIHQNSREIPFSKGFLKLDVTLHPLLKGRTVDFISCYSKTNFKLLTVHGRSGKVTDEENLDDSEISSKSLICIWNLFNLHEPERYLIVTGEPSCSCCISEGKNLIFSGLQDGSITVWDMNKSNLLLYELIEKNNKFQEPIYTTAIDSGHSSKIVSVQLLENSKSASVSTGFVLETSNEQICSLDETGVLITWGIISRNTQTNKNSWCATSLVQNSKLYLFHQNPDLIGLQCTDMNINSLDQNHMFISTNYGCILHCLGSGTKANPRRYNDLLDITSANCIEPCPFSPLYFIVGHENGNIVLHSRLMEKPLISMSNKEDSLHCGIQLLQWSQHKPCVFYAKDHSNTVHVWNLAISDFFPMYSVPFKENIVCMKLSPYSTSSNNDNNTSYVILAMESGLIYLHLINDEFGPNNSEKYQQEAKNFLNYVSRL